MNGSNSQIILPSKLAQQVHVETEETPSLTYVEEDIFIPDSTKILLTTVLKEISLYVQQEHLPDVANMLSHIFNDIDCVKVTHKGESRKKNKFFLQEYLNSLMVEGKSIRTIRYYKDTIESLSLYYPDVHFQDITTQQLREYFYNRMTYEACDDPRLSEQNISSRRKKWSKRTADNNRRILNTFFQWLVGERLIIFNPLQPIKKIKYERTIKQPFTPEEIIKLREGCITPRDHALVEFLLSTGCRAREVINVKVNDIDWQNQELIVHGKGGKDRYVYLNDATVYHLKEYLDSRTDGCEYLWINQNYIHGEPRPLTHGGLRESVKLIGQRAGVKDVHPHKFRHTFATTALNKGISLEEVQVMMGHANPDTTLIYAKVSHDNVRHAHRQYMN